MATAVETGLAWKLTEALAANGTAAQSTYVYFVQRIDVTVPSATAGIAFEVELVINGLTTTPLIMSTAKVASEPAIVSKRFDPPLQIGQSGIYASVLTAGAEVLIIKA